MWVVAGEREVNFRAFKAWILGLMGVRRANP